MDKELKEKAFSICRYSNFDQSLNIPLVKKYIDHLEFLLHNRKISYISMSPLSMAMGFITLSMVKDPNKIQFVKTPVFKKYNMGDINNEISSLDNKIIKTYIVETHSFSTLPTEIINADIVSNIKNIVDEINIQIAEKCYVYYLFNHNSNIADKYIYNSRFYLNKKEAGLNLLSLSGL